MASRADFERRVEEFKRRNTGRMRKKPGFAWVAGKFELPFWMVEEVRERAGGELRGPRVNEVVRGLIEAGLEVERGKRMVKAGSEEMGELVVTVGGETARRMREWRGKYRVSWANTIRDLVYWAINVAGE